MPIAAVSWTPPPPPHEVLGRFEVEFFTPFDSRIDEFSLRHAVFVEEYGWLAPDPAGTRQERDEYDASAVSFLLRDRTTGEPAACQRFILPDRVPAGISLPVERLSHGVVGEGLDRAAWAEVSRTTVAARYRWGSESNEVPALMGIKFASLALAAAIERDTIFSVSDPRTARLVRRAGIDCHRIGPVFQYHGSRTIYRLDMPATRATVRDADRVALEGLTLRARAALQLEVAG